VGSSTSTSPSLLIARPFPSRALGVGKSTCRSEGPPVRPMFGCGPVVSLTVGVGSKEPPLAPVWGADVGCSETRPVRIEPETGKVTEDNVKARSSSDDGANVFQDDESGS
jgi:hypothetical protein